LLHGRRRPWAARPQQLLQHRFDSGLALTRRQVQDPQVRRDGTLAVLLDPPVIDQAETAGREQLVTVAVAGERSRLTHQPVNDMPVVDAMLAPTPQSRQAFHKLLGVPDLEVAGMPTCLDPLADQAAGHRVGVAADMDGAAAIDTHRQALASVQALGRQRPPQR
jgi:hypothetical protein